VGWADSLSQVKQVIADMALALGEKARGEAMIAELDARLRAVAARAELREGRVRTVIFEPNGFTSGQGSLADELMGLAGLENLSASAGYGTGAVISIEAILMLRPQLLLLNTHRLSGDSRAELLLRHPALFDLSPPPAQNWIPSRLWLCPGPWVAEAAERMARAGEVVRASKQISPRTPARRIQTRSEPRDDRSKRHRHATLAWPLSEDQLRCHQAKRRTRAQALVPGRPGLKGNAVR
jgi:hypothetical protein